jgi:hypothetical protein
LFYVFMKNGLLYYVNTLSKSIDFFPFPKTTREICIS